MKDSSIWVEGNRMMQLEERERELRGSTVNNLKHQDTSKPSKNPGNDH